MKTIKITADNKISIVDVDFSNNRAIMDALNKVAYHDDTQIVSLSMEKFYSDSPRVEVTINSI